MCLDTHLPAQKRNADSRHDRSVLGLGLTLLSGRVTVPGFAEVALPFEKPMNVLAEFSMFPAFLQTLIHLPFWPIT